MGWFDKYIIKLVFNETGRRIENAPCGYIAGGDPLAGVYMVERTKWSKYMSDAMEFDSKEDAKYFMKQLLKGCKADGIDLSYWVADIEYIPIKDKY